MVLVVNTHRLDGKMFPWLNSEVIGHPEMPCIIQGRSGAIECALEVVSRTSAILDAQLVVAAKECFFPSSVKQADGPARRALNVDGAAVRIKDVCYVTASHVRVIEPKGQFSERHMDVGNTQIDILLG